MRRLAAVVLASSLGLFQAEALIADVCDGDASPAEIAALTGAASDLPRQEAPDAPRVTTERVATTPTITAAGIEGANRGPAGGHPVHTCHCVHAHTAVVALASTQAATPLAPASAVVGVSERTPPSAPHELRDRPPLA